MQLALPGPATHHSSSFDMAISFIVAWVVVATSVEGQREPPTSHNDSLVAVEVALVVEEAGVVA